MSQEPGAVREAPARAGRRDRGAEDSRQTAPESPDRHGTGPRPGETGWRRGAFRLALVFAIMFLWFGSRPRVAAAQTIPVEALAAEGRQAWDEALAIYRATLEREPNQADLWVRVSDIHARLGRMDDAIKALEAAVHAGRERPDLYARLSRAYASVDQPKAAYAAIQAALALSPDEPAYLRAAGDLASWSGNYGGARAAYRRLLELKSDEADTLLALARVSTWDGATDQAVTIYRRYLDRQPADAAVWLEAARAESWRGHDAGALDLLRAYRLRFGETDDYRRELASALTRARRPNRALSVLRPLLAGNANDYDLQWQHALAQTEYGAETRAERAFDAVAAIGPERRETSNLARQLRIAFGSVLQPSGSAYNDSDGLQSYRVPVALALSVAPGVRLQAGYERQELRARVGSGLERIDGGRDESLDRGWIGTELRPWAPIIIRASAGRHDSSVREEWAYGGGVTLRAGDALRLEYDREHSLMTISPRAVSLGLLRDVDRLRLAWSPTVSFVLDMEGSREDLSDSNERWAARVAPRFALVRNQRLNLDAGASAYLFGARHNLSNGYYDPELYEAYALTLLPYFKFSENHGLSLFIEAGVQKDDSRQSFEPGGSLVGELTLGIYRAWVLKVNGGATMNARLESGAFRGYSGSLVLIRRF